MAKLQNKLQIFKVYLIITASLYGIGLITGYLLNGNSLIFSNLESALSSSLQSFGAFRLSNVTASFGSELFYLAFILFATLTVYRPYLYCCAVAYKGILAGLFGAVFMRVMKGGPTETRFEIPGCMIFSALTALTLCLLCWLCAEGSLFSRHIIYPPKLKYLLKRKDTYSFLSVFLAICGAVLIIIILKQGDLFLMLSPKGM